MFRFEKGKISISLNKNEPLAQNATERNGGTFNNSSNLFIEFHIGSIIHPPEKKEIHFKVSLWSHVLALSLRFMPRIKFAIK